ncbi:PKD domain-containing protein, partial [Candidatus Omnitrophota bacterium]
QINGSGTGDYAYVDEVLITGDEGGPGPGPLLVNASANTAGGDIPLTVHFSSTAIGGSGNYSYSWDFGDGGSASTQNPTYIYTSAGDYTAIVTVDDGQDTAQDSVPISVDEPPLPTIKLEFGTIDLTTTIDRGHSKTINFSNTYVEPVVAAYIMTRRGGQSIDVRITDVTSTGAEIFLEEPDDQGHNRETIGYIVMERGAYTLSDGTRVEAEKLETNSVHREGSSIGGDTVNFSQEFSSEPVVLHTLNTYNNNAFMSSVSRDVTSDNFRLQQEAAGSGSAAVAETIGWIAIESDKSGTIGGRQYITGRGDDGLNDGVDDNTPHVISYTFSTPPIIVVDGYTGNGGNGYWARSAGAYSSTTHTVFAEEDQVGDSERVHTNEAFNWWAIADVVPYQPPPGKEIDF